MLPKLVGIGYFDATEQGAQEAAKELGVDLVYDGPTDAKVEDQIKMIDGWMVQGYDVIAVAPNDPDAIADSLKKAKDLDTTVVTWDTDANPQASQRASFVTPADNQAIADSLVQLMVEGVKSQGKELAGDYLIVSGTATAANQNVWIQLMRERIAADYPDIHLLEPLTPGEDQQKAYEQTSVAVNAHAGLKGIWGITSVACPAAAKAARDASKADQIYVTGLSLPNLMREYVEDGTVKKFALWNAVDLGYLTVHVAQQQHAGQLKPGVRDFGRLKNVEVREGEVILGPPLVFDKQNIGEFQF